VNIESFLDCLKLSRGSEPELFGPLRRGGGRKPQVQLSRVVAPRTNTKRAQDTEIRSWVAWLLWGIVPDAV